MLDRDSPLGKILENTVDVGEFGRIPGRSGGNDFAVAEEEGARHLAAVAGEVADTTAAENAEEAPHPDNRAEEFPKAASTEAEGTVEFTIGVRDAVDII